MQNDHLNKTDVRLHRIRKISRVLKICVLVYFLVPVCFLALNFQDVHSPPGTFAVFEHSYASARDIPAPMLLLAAVGAGVYLLGVVSFYRLLSLYENGIIFSAANVLQMKRLGSSLAGYGILSVASNIVYTGKIIFPWVMLQGLSPWIVVGAALNIIAWIMDEGRKIQEEQALTV